MSAAMSDAFSKCIRHQRQNIPGTSFLLLFPAQGPLSSGAFNYHSLTGHSMRLCAGVCFVHSKNALRLAIRTTGRDLVSQLTCYITVCRPLSSAANVMYIKPLMCVTMYRSFNAIHHMPKHCNYTPYTWPTQSYKQETTARSRLWNPSLAGLLCQS
jgi:hypothetical protein